MDDLLADILDVTRAWVDSDMVDQVQPDADLRALGLDSLGVVALMVDLEEKLGVVIPTVKIVWDTFCTPSSIAAACTLPR